MTTSFSRGISRCRFFRLCWRAPVILITCAGILPRDVEPISQAQPFLFSNEIALSTQGLVRRNAGCAAKMRVSIVIPCYNEKDTIEKVVEAVRNAPLTTKEMWRQATKPSKPLLSNRLSLKKIGLASSRNSLPSSRSEAVAFMMLEFHIADGLTRKARRLIGKTE